MQTWMFQELPVRNLQGEGLKDMGFVTAWVVFSMVCVEAKIGRVPNEANCANYWLVAVGIRVLS